MHDALLISEVLSATFDYLAADMAVPKCTRKAGRRAPAALER